MAARRYYYSDSITLRTIYNIQYGRKQDHHISDGGRTDTD